MIIENFPNQFSQIGQVLIYILAGLSGLIGLSGIVNIVGRRPFLPQPSRILFVLVNLLFLTGFGLICWLHWHIYQDLPLQLPAKLVPWLNQQLAAMNSQATYAFSLYDPAHPPRYAIPLWIDNEKYYFWFMAYSLMSYLAWRWTDNHRLRGTLQLFLAIQVSILITVANPFAHPLTKFFTEITPWFKAQSNPMVQLGMFMKLYPRMVFYYNAIYMWMHPPMLFISYACITITFITSFFMLIKRELAIEVLGYDFAKFGYFMLTFGMLLGYPWALEAWGPNWWWDPKICSSIMMWAIYSTYLHTRLYANKKGMWYFTSLLGVLCFLAMIFTFITSFYFPGAHSFVYEQVMPPLPYKVFGYGLV